MDRVFGFSEEWKAFEQRHILFFERYTNFERMLAITGGISRRSTTSLERFISYQSRLCVESFLEIMICCANGYGLAAQKLLRSFYEQAVTLRYIFQNPSKYEDFRSYLAVTNYKLIKATEEIYGHQAVSDKTREEVNSTYTSVKDRFIVAVCKQCGTKRVNHSWSKLDFVAMAKQTGELAKLLIECYYIPLRGSHASMAGLFDRLESPTLDTLVFNGNAQRYCADKAFRFGLLVVFDALDVLDSQFREPGLADAIRTCRNDFEALLEALPLAKGHS